MPTLKTKYQQEVAPALMQKFGYEVRQDNYLSFKGVGDERFMRTDTLGTAYFESGIRKRIQGIDVPNHSKSIFGNKTCRFSNRKRLKFEIDTAMKKADSYDDFLQRLRNVDIEIKQGKYLAMRIPNTERFIRTKSLGYEYTEEMLELYFVDRDLYNLLLKCENETKIEHLEDNSKKIYRYNGVDSAGLKDDRPGYEKEQYKFRIKITIYILPKRNKKYEQF